MANDLETSVFLPGGRTIFVVTNETDSKGITLTRQGDDEHAFWLMSVNVKIPADEALGVIRKFSDFEKPAEDQSFENRHPNQVYFNAFKEDGSSLAISCKSAGLNVFFDHKSMEGGQIVLSLTPSGGIHKTDNGGGKTDNGNVDADPQG